MTTLHYDLNNRKAQLWSDARLAGEKMNKALADGDRILATLWARDVIDAVGALSEIAHIEAVSQFMDPANYNQTKQKVEASSEAEVCQSV